MPAEWGTLRLPGIATSYGGSVLALRITSLPGVVGAALAAAFVFAGTANAQDASVPMSELMVEGPLGDVWLGDENAPVTVIEYASMTCPHCAAFHNEVYDAFKEKYIDTGLVRFTLREFPIDPPQVPLSAAAFMLTRCAPGENGYYALIDLLFENQPMWAGVSEPIPPLLQLAQQSGFTEESFSACLNDQEVLDAVYWVYDRGADLGVNATPTFFINGDQYTGELTLEQLDTIIEPMLP